MTLSLIHELSLEQYNAGKLPLWIALIPGEQLLLEHTCDDQEIEGATGACRVRIYRKEMQRAA